MIETVSQEVAERPKIGELDEQVRHQARISRWQTAILALTAVIAIAAAGIALYAAEKQQAFDAEIFANQTWESYRRLEMEYIHEASKKEFDSTDQKMNDMMRSLMMERLLMAADGVTIAMEDDPQWRDSFVYEFRKYPDYLLSDEFLKSEAGVMSSYCTFRVGVRNWLLHGFRSQPKAYAKLLKAEDECQKTLDDEGFSE